MSRRNRGESERKACFEGGKSFYESILGRFGSFSGVSDKNLDVLNRCNQQVLYTMSFQSAPAGSLEMVTGGIGKASFTDVKPASPILSASRTVGLLFAKINQFLIEITDDGSSCF